LAGNFFRKRDPKQQNEETKEVHNVEKENKTQPKLENK
jgi:hypothetical protein